MSGEKDTKTTNEDYLDVATPPRPGSPPAAHKASDARPTDPKMSPHFKEGENPVWISCRATPDCEGKYAVEMFSGDISLEGGGGNWIRYKCLTCGGAFHIVR